LADGLSSNFDLEVDAPHVSELNLGVGVEAIIAAVDGVLVVGWATVQHVGVVAVGGEEGIGELIEAQTKILVSVVTGQEKINLFTGREDTDSRETLTDVSSRNVATVVNIKNAESIVQVEVRLVGKGNFGLLKLTLKWDDVAESVNKTIFLVDVEDGLLGGGNANGAGTRVDGARAAVTAAGVVSASGTRAATDRWASHGAASHRRASHGGATDWAAADGRAHTDGGAADGAAVSVSGVSTRQGAGLEGGAVASALHHAAAVVRRLGAGHRFSGGSTSRGVRGANEVGELGIAETSITISVHAANDGEELALARVVTARAEEWSKVVGINATIVVFVDGAVGSQGRVVVAGLELTLEDIKTALEVDLLLDNVEESGLDVTSQVVKSTDAASGAVDCDVPEQVVLAREEHLEETKSEC
jgi:hypothetical protein